MQYVSGVNTGNPTLQPCIRKSLSTIHGFGHYCVSTRPSISLTRLICLRYWMVNCVCELYAEVRFHYNLSTPTEESQTRTPQSNYDTMHTYTTRPTLNPLPKVHLHPTLTPNPSPIKIPQLRHRTPQRTFPRHIPHIRLFRFSIHWRKRVRGQRHSILRRPKCNQQVWTWRPRPRP